MRPIHSLIFVAVMIAVIWRVEIELRGWGGLTWIGYQHLAIPLGGLIYLVWIRVVTQSRPHSWRMVLYAAGWGAGANLVLSAFADAYFGGYWSYLTTVIYLGNLGSMIPEAIITLLTLITIFEENVQHEARLTGSARSMHDKCWDSGEASELEACQPLFSMRLFGLRCAHF